MRIGEAARSSSPRPVRHSRVGSNRLNLELKAKRQRSYLISQARWKTRNVCEGLTVETIDSLVVGDVFERDVD